VLSGGDEHTLAHEAGGVADLGDVAASGWDLEVVEVGSAKEDTTAAGRGEQAHSHRGSTVQANTCEFKGCGYGLFKVKALYQNGKPRPKLGTKA